MKLSVSSEKQKQRRATIFANNCLTLPEAKTESMPGMPEVLLVNIAPPLRLTKRPQDIEREENDFKKAFKKKLKITEEEQEDLEVHTRTTSPR